MDSFTHPAQGARAFLRRASQCLLFFAIGGFASSGADAKRLIQVLAEKNSADVAQNFLSEANSVLKKAPGVDVALELLPIDRSEIVKRIGNGDWTLAILSAEAARA